MRVGSPAGTKEHIMSAQREEAVLIGRRIENRKFVSLDLRGAVISNVVGRNIVLCGCDLTGASISWCQFESLTLEDCVLDNAEIENVVITSGSVAGLDDAVCHRVLVNGTMLDPDPEIVLEGACWLLEQMHNLFGR
jgi:uncharacterized protein YjbI with pentapeptide repeats